MSESYFNMCNDGDIALRNRIRLGQNLGGHSLITLLKTEIAPADYSTYESIFYLDKSLFIAGSHIVCTCSELFDQRPNKATMI